VVDRQRTGVVDGTAIAWVVTHDACFGNVAGGVGAKFAVVDRQRTGVVDGAAEGDPAAVTGVIVQVAGVERQDAVVPDGTPLDVRRNIGDDVVGQVAGVERQDALVPDGTPLAVQRTGARGAAGYAKAAGEVQVAQGDVRASAVDLEYP